MSLAEKLVREWGCIRQPLSLASFGRGYSLMLLLVRASAKAWMVECARRYFTTEIFRNFGHFDIVVILNN
jgi:hypothetical protein